MNFDPDNYTITIRKEWVDDEMLFVGRVAEFPDLRSFEETYEEARIMLTDCIHGLKEMADEAHEYFPTPNPIPNDEFSGRMTLRLPKSLHAKVSNLAEQDGVSVNHYIVAAVATYAGEADGTQNALTGAVNYIKDAFASTAIIMHAPLMHLISDETSHKQIKFIDDDKTLLVTSDTNAAFVRAAY